MFESIKKFFKKDKSSLSEKEIATENNMPYIKVLETHVNNQNPSNGFFELDWNSHFITQLREAGYTGNSEEEIIDKWFKALCQSIASEDQNGRDVSLG